jgi:hypothetical protein
MSGLFVNLACLGKIPRLVELTVLGGTAAGINETQAQSTLRYLTLRGLNLTDSDILGLDKLSNLEYICVQDNNLASLSVFDAMIRLRVLDVRGNNISEAELSRFRTKRADVALSHGKSAGWDKYIADSLRCLKDYGFNYSRRISIEGWGKKSRIEGQVIPFFYEGTDICVKQVGSTETCYLSDWMAVFVAYAQYFRDVEKCEGSITEKDHWFKWFVTHAGYPRSPSGTYSVSVR